jgi:hypothetical protein
MAKEDIIICVEAAAKSTLNDTKGQINVELEIELQGTEARQAYADIFLVLIALGQLDTTLCDWSFYLCGGIIFPLPKADIVILSEENFELNKDQRLLTELAGMESE